MSPSAVLSPGELSIQPTENNFNVVREDKKTPARGWRRAFSRSAPAIKESGSPSSTDGSGDYKTRPEKWSMGVLNDRETDEVPGKWLQAWANLDFKKANSAYLADHICCRLSTSHVQGIKKERASWSSECPSKNVSIVTSIAISPRAGVESSTTIRTHLLIPLHDRREEEDRKWANHT